MQTQQKAKLLSWEFHLDGCRFQSQVVLQSITQGTPGHVQLLKVLQCKALLPNLSAPVSVGNQLVSKQGVCKPISKTSAVLSSEVGI